MKTRILPSSQQQTLFKLLGLILFLYLPQVFRFAMASQTQSHNNNPFDKFDFLDENAIQAMVPCEFADPDNALFCSAINQQLAGVTKALNRGADIDTTNCYGATALSHAIKNLDWDMIALLIRYGADVNIADYHGNTLLFNAAYSNTPTLLQILLRAGANPNVRNLGFETPLLLAALHNKPKNVAVLIRGGADINAMVKIHEQNEQESLLSRVGKQHLPHIFKQFLDAGADPEIVDTQNSTTLIELIKRNYTDEIKYLIRAGVNLNGAGAKGHTPLITAIEMKYVTIVLQLIHAAVDLNAADDLGLTPLMHAVYHGPPIVVTHLLMYGANISIVSKSNHDVFDYALFRDIEIVAILLDYLDDMKINFPNIKNHFKRVFDKDNTKLINLFEKYNPNFSKEYMRDFYWSVLRSSFDHILSFLANPFIGIIAISYCIFKACSANYKRINDQIEKLEREKNFRKAELLKRNHAITTELNTLIQAFFRNLSWVVLQEQNTFYLTIPKQPLPIRLLTSNASEAHYPCFVDDNEFFKQFAQQLQLAYPHEKTIDHVLLRITIKLTQNDNFSILATNTKNIIATIKANLYPLCQNTVAFRLEKTKEALPQMIKEILVLESDIKQVTDSHKHSMRIISNVKSEILALSRDVTNGELTANKRAKRSLETLNRWLVKMETCPEIATCNANLTLLKQAVEQQRQQLFQSNIDAIQQQKINLTAKDNLRSTVNELVIDIKISHMSIMNELEEFKRAVCILQQDRPKQPKSTSTIAAELEERQRQREEQLRLKQIEQEREQEQRAHKKLQHAAKLEELKKQRQLQIQQEEARQERILQADELKKKAQREASTARAASGICSSSTSSCSSTPIDLQQAPALLQEKIITLGDVLQRYNKAEDKTEATRIECKYALLSLCLRLFELIKQYTHSFSARSIRNTLMHHHAFFDVDALYEFANLLAHQPQAVITEAVKLEDILKPLDQRQSPMLIRQLANQLNVLRHSEFFIHYVRPIHEPATSHTHLQTIRFLMQDLANLSNKQELHLAYFPDKVLAIKGILMCMGECYQQLLLTEKVETLDLPLPITRLLREAHQHRNAAGHQLQEEPENLYRYENYFRKAHQYVQLLDQLLMPLKESPFTP